jgi:hypothetical protein
VKGYTKADTTKPKAITLKTGSMEELKASERKKAGKSIGQHLSSPLFKA